MSLPSSGAWLAAVLMASPPADAPPAPCAQRVQVYRAGRPADERCPDDARAAGMTVLDLGDGWTPYPLHDAAVAAGVAPPAYRSTFVALADGQFGDDAQARADRHLELYGVPPNFRAVRAAMDDDARHRCHDAVDDAALADLPVPLRRESAPSSAAARSIACARRSTPPCAAAA